MGEIIESYIVTLCSGECFEFDECNYTESNYPVTIPSLYFILSLIIWIMCKPNFNSHVHTQFANGDDRK